MKQKILLLFLYNSLFSNQPINYKGRLIPLKTIKGLRSYTLGDLLFIEQNPYKKSEYAVKTRRGSKIAWLIDKKNNKYLSRIENGKVYIL